MKNILIVEDKPDDMKWLSKIISDIYPNVKILKADDYGKAREIVDKSHEIGLAFIDKRLPGGRGDDLLPIIEEHSPKCKKIIYTAFQSDEEIYRALRKGAQGYLTKDQSTEEIKTMLKKLEDGHPPLSPCVAYRIMGYFKLNPKVRLTRRESGILECISKGMTDKEIGKELKISHNTVSSRVKDILNKMGAKTRAEAVRKTFGKI